MAYISEHELRAQKLQEAAQELHNLRAKSRDGSEPNSTRSRRRQTYENDPSNGSRPSSSRSSSRKSRLSNAERPVMLETDHPELFLTPRTRGHPHKILPANWDEPDDVHAHVHGHVAKTPRSVPTTPRNGVTPRSYIKLEPLPNRTPRNGASFDSKMALFSTSQSPSQSSMGVFSPQETPQQSIKSARRGSNKKASISVSTAQLSTFQRVYSTSKISQGVGGLDQKYGQLAKEAIVGLGLQDKDIMLLKTAFDVLDEDKSGEIDNLEFLHALGETDKQGEVSNPFIDNFFQRIDVDRIERDSDGGMNFEEFLVMSATFLMFTHIDMVRFVFECHNKAGSGCFGPQDFVDLSKQINAVVVNGGPKDWIVTRDKYDKIGKNTFQPNVHIICTLNLPNLLSEFKLIPFVSLFVSSLNLGKGYLNEAEFIQMSKDYPQLIYFASRMQLKLQNLTFGEPFYHKLLQRQHRARITEEYKNTHDGKPPPESMITIGLRKFTICFSSDTYDVRTNDNTQLLNLGRIMFDRNFSMQRPVITKQKSFKNPSSSPSPSPSPSKRPKSARKTFS